MRIAIVGVGGVGGYYGARFRAGGVSTVFLARGRTLEAIQESGITVESPFGDVHTPVESTDDPDRIGPCDAVFICVKSYDTQSASSSLDPLLKPDTAVITLQNGINNARFSRRPSGRAMSSVAQPTSSPRWSNPAGWFTPGVRRGSLSGRWMGAPQVG